MDQTDKDHILRTNQYYIAQVSSMEIKISELKAQLHAKDFEIDYLASKLSPTKSGYNKTKENHETELQLSIALQENEALKKKISNIEEINVIKSQLEHALHMKDIFEQKYRELNLQVLINEKHSTLESEKDEIIKNLKKSLETQKKLAEEYQEKYEASYNENGSLKQEIIDRNKQIQELKKKIFRLNQQENERSGINSSTFSVPAPSLFHRPSSATNSRKNSPDITAIKNSNLRKNLKYNTPKLNATAIISKSPKIVNISLDNTLAKQ